MAEQLSDLNGLTPYVEKYQALSTEQLEKKLKKLKKPGRPSKDVRAIRLLLGDQETPATEVKARAPAKKAEKTTKKQKAEIYIAPPQLMTMEIEVVGISPLIMHAWSEKAIKQMEDEQQGLVKKAKKGFRNPTEEYEAARYKDNKGDFIPGVNFKLAICDAAILIDGLRRTTLNKTIYVVEDKVYIKHNKKAPSMRRDMVRVGKFGNQSAMPRYRPQYDKWSCKFTLQIDAELLTPEQVINLVNRAGFYGGVGEWRPQKSGGNYGRFKVSKAHGR